MQKTFEFHEDSYLAFWYPVLMLTFSFMEVESQKFKDNTNKNKWRPQLPHSAFLKKNIHR